MAALRELGNYYKGQGAGSFRTFRKNFLGRSREINSLTIVLI